MYFETLYFIVELKLFRTNKFINKDIKEDIGEK